MNSKYIHVIDGDRPILLEMPHSGDLGIASLDGVPGVIANKIRFKYEAVRRTVGFGCDSAVPEMSGFFRRIRLMGLSGIYNDLARVYCDTNRDRNEASGLALEGADPDKNHHGVIWARTVPTDVDLDLPTEELTRIVKQRCESTLEAPLTRQEFEILMAEVYDPYHATVQELHEKIVAKYGFCIHLALHSLPPFSVTLVDGGYVCGQKARRGHLHASEKKVLKTLPDVILIHNDFAAADKMLVDVVRKAFESAGLIVDDGLGPFLGDKGVTKLYGNPEETGVHVIGIEHVTYDIEPERHLGSIDIDTQLAERMQPVYEQAVTNLLR